MENRILAAIKARRSIRKFQEAQIPHETLHSILEAATYSPSGSNSQSWLFTAIQNRAVLEELNEAARQALSVMELEEHPYPAKAAAKKNAAKEEYNFFYHAPTLVIVSNVASYANAMADCAAALQNIFLAAHSFGLGSCWINQLTWTTDDPVLRDFLYKLGIPKEHCLCGAAALGYIAGDIPPTPRRKENTINLIL